MRQARHQIGDQQRSPNRPQPVVVITGGSSGIGRCTAALFAERGWRVGLIARGEEGLEAAAADVVAAGGEVETASADVADAREVDAAASRIEGRFGQIDAWINGAGVSFYAPFEDISEEEFRRVTDVSYMGAVNGTRAALTRMRRRDEGVIVNIGSVVALRGVPLQAPYTAAKFAVTGFTEALRTELIHARSRIHLAIVHPPATNTPFFAHAGSRMEGGVPRPMPPVYEPEVVAAAIYDAVTMRRRSVRVGAATVQFGILNRLMPGLADRLMGRFGWRSQATHAREAQDLRDPAVFGAARRNHAVHGPWRQPGRDRLPRLGTAGSLAFAAGGLALGLWIARSHRNGSE
ncbi:hypothetical protein GCM10011505_27980 [Tistrella bauzanensis]|uniref:Ketoreductase domain-containing protein n=1 Tax=Tistrella bauzanensis TaxID=657419 RepID=A0ABQ1IMX4_9PROT|nr:SDR family oxidoreductase [Tistrella bauzanensis]GGB45100.1 hypothetical protein GCM10011505_27980 [Tistrella bauzanensis]